MDTRKHDPRHEQSDKTDLAGGLAIEIAGGPLGEVIHILESVEDMLAPIGQDEPVPPAIRPADRMKPGRDMTLRGPGAR